MNLRRGVAKIAIGHVDGDALLALGLQAIDQQCHVEIGARGSDAHAVGGERGGLVFQQELAIVEQTPDQR